MSGEKSNPSTISYAEAGVDIEAGAALVDRIAPMASLTKRLGSMDNIGGFGGLFDLKACGYSDPVLVAATDGVGTKLKLAFEAEIHNSVGIDLVAMCVNDLLVQGAEPLFFLDYFACGTLEVSQAADVVEGIAKGCQMAGCQLVGGETAEMPGMYAAGEYDLAGFAVGAVERGGLLPNKAALEAGTVVLGLASSGLHSNGFSLLRKLAEAESVDWHAPAPFDADRSFGEACLTPTRIYIESLLPLVKAGKLLAMAHITGGGLLENIPRVLPDDLACELSLDSWPLPPVYQWIQQTGRVEKTEMLKSFNCGIGMAVMVAPQEVESVKAALNKKGEIAYEIGVLTKCVDQAVMLKGELA